MPVGPLLHGTELLLDSDTAMDTVTHTIRPVPENGTEEFLGSQTHVATFCDQCYKTTEEEYEAFDLPAGYRYIIGVAAKCGKMPETKTPSTEKEAMFYDKMMRYNLPLNAICGLTQVAPGPALFNHHAAYPIGTVACYWHVHTKDKAFLYTCIVCNDSEYCKTIMEQCGKTMCTALSLGSVGDHRNYADIDECSLVAIPMRDECFCVIAKDKTEARATMRDMGFAERKKATLLASLDCTLSTERPDTSKERLHALTQLVEALNSQIVILTDKETLCGTYVLDGAKNFTERTGRQTKLLTPETDAQSTATVEMDQQIPPMAQIPQHTHSVPPAIHHAQLASVHGPQPAQQLTAAPPTQDYYYVQPQQMGRAPYRVPQYQQYAQPCGFTEELKASIIKDYEATKLAEQEKLNSIVDTVMSRIAAKGQKRTLESGDQSLPKKRQCDFEGFSEQVTAQPFVGNQSKQAPTHDPAPAKAPLSAAGVDNDKLLTSLMQTVGDLKTVFLNYVKDQAPVTEEESVTARPAQHQRPVTEGKKEKLQAKCQLNNDMADDLKTCFIDI